ncbi:MAG: hypothetical protein GX131_19670 [candidate division WS1 bacterium]|jgi:hypothetical protein|nr:hypothetical protein [candidate division WS1 bacterium]
MRAMLAVALLTLVVTCHAATVLNKNGQLTDASPQLDGGEPYEAFNISFSKGDIVRCICTTDDFTPFLLAATDDERNFEMGGNELTFFAKQDGEAVVAVTSLGPHETGLFNLQVEVLPLKVAEGELPPALLDVNERLGPGDQALETGEFIRMYEVSVPEGHAAVVLVDAEFDAYLFVAVAGGEFMEVDDVDGRNPEYVWIGGGDAFIYVTSARPGETGAYRLTVLSAEIDRGDTAEGDAP